MNKSVYKKLCAVLTNNCRLYRNIDNGINNPTLNLNETYPAVTTVVSHGYRE